MITISIFRVVNLIEGISYLLLLFVAMPAKYIWHYPEMVSMMGWIHGLLFIAYCLIATQLAQRLNWLDRLLYLVIIAGMIPFACFLVDRRLARGELESGELDR